MSAGYTFTVAVFPARAGMNHHQRVRRMLATSGRASSQFCDYAKVLPSVNLNIGTEIVRIIPAEKITGDSAIPENAVVFTKVYFED